MPLQQLHDADRVEPWGHLSYGSLQNKSLAQCAGDFLFQSVMGPKPMQLVVVMAVRKAVRAATITFTATSTIRFFMRHLPSG